LELSCRDYIEKIPGIITMGVTHGDKNAILTVYTTKVKYSASSIVKSNQAVRGIWCTTLPLIAQAAAETSEIAVVTATVLEVVVEVVVGLLVIVEVVAVFVVASTYSNSA
jgi:hypothetical protein